MRIGLCILLGLGTATTFKLFQDAIPNGEGVPHPCKPNYIWQGVGHLNPLGGGNRNPFGRDFEENGMVWDNVLCQKDSDGDGKTNGAELGDPQCKWRAGGEAPSGVATGHPGVCESVTSNKCKDTLEKEWPNKVCQVEDTFKCDALDDSNVSNFTIRYPPTKLPTDDTTYNCMMFDIPLDLSKEYHIVADSPAINNSYVSHHIIAYGCPDSEEADKLAVEFRTVKKCGMIAGENTACPGSVGGWTVGQLGSCWPENVGIPIGKGGFTRILMEIHYNNPFNVANYEDSSGMNIYFSEVLRPNVAASLVVGPMSIVIPPNSPRHEEDGICYKECTQYMGHPIYIFDASLHMHYLGREGHLEIWRNGAKIKDLVQERDYSYDRFIGYYYDPPVELQPGDEIKMKCVYKSTSKNEITYYGDATLDEMCFGFISYYPPSNLLSCVSNGKLGHCGNFDISPYGYFTDPNYNGCDVNNFLTEASMTKFVTDLYSSACGSAPNCTEKCFEYLEEEYKKPCMVIELRMGMEQYLAVYYPDVVKMMRICDERILLPDTSASAKAAISHIGLAICIAGYILTYGPFY